MRFRGAKGFTLIELLVVVLIIGILAAIAIPQYFKVVEKGKAAESLQWINDLKGAEQRYLLANNGNFNSVLSQGFDITLVSSLKNFTSPVTGITLYNTATPPYWTLTMARNATPAYYGAYSVEVASNGSIECVGGLNSASCQTDLLP